MEKKLASPTDKIEEFAAFREAVSDVKPLNQPARSQSRAPQPAPYPRQLEKDELAAKSELLEEPEGLAELEIGDELLFLRAGVQKRYLKRLRRGRYSFGDHLDLHQMNVETASRALLGFIDAAASKGIECVRVVHGKGLRSRKGPVLKMMTRHLLIRHPLVVAFSSCRPADGGTGAVSILLKALKTA